MIINGVAIPQIKPYVTDKGGVVIMNGPFSIDQASRVAVLCESAPELLAAAKDALAYLETCEGGFAKEKCEQLEAAIAAAEGRKQDHREVGRE